MFARASRRICTGLRPMSTTAYPFSKTAIVQPTRWAPPPEAVMKGKGVMPFLQKHLPPPEKQEMLRKYFSRQSRNCLRPGSVVSVVMEQAPTMFTGILLSIRRRGPATSFILRNVVQRTGVEMQIFPCSPLVKDIRVEKLPPKRFQLRAKLFYLREAPEKMSALASGKLKDR